MRVTIPTLAAAISLTVFACSESPSSSNEDSSSSEGGFSSSSEVPSSSSEVPSSSSEVPSSSSGALSATVNACEYSGEEFGINELFGTSGLFICAEVQSDAPNWQAQKNECDEDGGTWTDASCPSGEKATCIDDEDVNAKDVLYKLYAEDFTCGDFSMKNADGSPDITPKGGACGPIMIQEGLQISMCAEFPMFPTNIIKISCANMEVPFVNECQDNADLICYDPKEDMIAYLYGEEALLITCDDLEMEEL